MDANLTRYDIWVEGDKHESELVVEQSESGEWVKFADVKESLSKSHNKHCGKAGFKIGGSAMEKNANAEKYECKDCPVDKRGLCDEHYFCVRNVWEAAQGRKEKND